MTILLFTFLSVLLLHTSAWAEHRGTNLVEREGVSYYPFHEDPVNGRVVQWHENGQKKSEANYIDGKRVGVSYEWDSDGKIRTGTIVELSLIHI